MIATTVERRAAIAKVKIAAKELRLEDDVYRDLLERITGRRSAADCTEAQLGQVLEELKAKGWAPRPSAKTVKSGAGRRPAQSPMAKKARALWISLHQLGVVREPSEKALEAFGRRQLGVDRLAWADEGLAYRLIEALKAMANRAGWQQDVQDERQWVGEVLILKRRLYVAQEDKLAALNPPYLSNAADARTLDEDDLDERIRENADDIWALLKRTEAAA